MPKYNPFAERAGMQKVSVHEPAKEALGVAEVLKGFGFDVQLLGSQRYVRGKLEGLTAEQVSILKEAFKKNDNLRFRRELVALRHVPYGTTKLYREGIEILDLEHLAKLVRVVGVLLQTKVYLFWKLNSNCY